MKKRIPYTRKVSLAVFGSYLVITGMVHEPQPKKAPDKDFIESTYIRPTGELRFYASEKRKRKILSEIRKIREAIRTQAQVYYAKNRKYILRTAEQVPEDAERPYDQYRKLRAATVRERTYINSTRLILKLRAKLREQYDESNSRQERKVTVDFGSIG